MGNVIRQCDRVGVLRCRGGLWTKAMSLKAATAADCVVFITNPTNDSILQQTLKPECPLRFRVPALRIPAVRYYAAGRAPDVPSVV